VRRRFLISLALIGLISCRKDPVVQPYQEEVPDTTDIAVVYEPLLPDSLYDYESITYPDYFLDDPLLNLISSLGSTPQVTNEGATLGRVLFYDKQLSANNTISCASCHHQDKGFADGLQFSTGFEGQQTSRNSMAIINTNFNRRFFWDRRASTLHAQSLIPIEDPVEMGMQLNLLENKLSGIEYYKPLFETAFGDSIITAQRISFALSQFMQSIRSFNSKYDKGLENNFADFTPQELQGKDMYLGGQFSCNNCHITVNFGGVSADVNGLVANPIDLGIGAISGDPEDEGRFKTVSLRNIELTAPYMHDGRFQTLEEVVEFYSTDIQAHPFLDDRLTTNNTVGGPPEQFNFTSEEVDALVAFMKTLTDWELVNNPIYSNPFPE